MMKGLNVQSLLLVFLAFMGIVLYGTLKPKPVDWRYSYSTKEKIPFGLLVFKNELDKLFDGAVIDDLVFDEFTAFDLSHHSGISQDNEMSTPTTIMYINSINDWDTIMVNKVLHSVSHGQNAFISATRLPLYLSDTLGFNILTRQNHAVYYEDSLSFSLNNVEEKKWLENVGVSGSFIYQYDTLATTVLGCVEQDTMNTNFIRISYGAGSFFIHTEPILFTNYHLLNSENYKYVEDILSHISPSNRIVWGQVPKDKKVIKGGILRYIMSQDALKWAWFVIIVGLLLFIITHMRRPQRIIPVIPPNENTTLQFVASIGDLYMRQSSIRHLMDRKIIYLLERVRSQYFISTDKLDDIFITKLSQLSGKKIEIVKNMVFLLQKHRDSDYICSTDDLRRLNQAIENFYS